MALVLEWAAPAAASSAWKCPHGSPEVGLPPAWVGVGIPCGCGSEEDVGEEIDWPCLDEDTREGDGPGKVTWMPRVVHVPDY